MEVGKRLERGGFAGQNHQLEFHLKKGWEIVVTRGAPQKVGGWAHGGRKQVGGKISGRRRWGEKTI